MNTLFGPALRWLLCLLCCLALAPGVAWAQEDPAQQGEPLLIEGLTLLNEGKAEEALAKFEAALPLYRQAEDRTGEAYSLLLMGSTHLNYLADPERGRTFLMEALPIFEEVSKPLDAAATLELIGKSYQLQRNDTEALRLFHESLRIYEEQQSPINQAGLLADIGGVYMDDGALDQAEDSFEAALALLTGDDTAGMRSTILIHMSSVRRAQQRYDDALALLEEARTLNNSANNPLQNANIVLEIALVEHRRGHSAQAVELMNEARTTFKEYHLPQQESNALHNLGFIYLDMGRYGDAQEALNAALAIRQEISDPESEAATRSALGQLHMLLGQYPEAAREYERSRELAEALNAPYLKTLIAGDLGSLYRRQGRYEDALREYQAALDLSTSVDDASGVATILNNMGNVYMALGRYQEAGKAYEQSLTLVRDTNPAEAGATLTNLAGWHQSQDRYAEALTSYQKALAIAESIQDQQGMATTLNNMGGLYADQERYEEAIPLLDRALALQRAIGDREGEGRTQSGLGAVYNELGRYPDALEHLAAAEAIQSSVGDIEGQAVTIGNQAFSYYQQGQTAMALERHRYAVDLIESVQAQLHVDDLSASFSAQQRPVYDRLINTLATEGEPVLAFSYAERARARSFLSHVGNQALAVSSRATGDLAQQEVALRQQIAAQQIALHNEQSLDLALQDETLIKDLQDSLEAARNQYKALLEKIKLVDPQYASFVSVSPASLEDIRKTALGEATTLLVYFVTEDQTLAWVIDQTTVELITLPIKRADLKNNVDTLQNLIRSGQFEQSSSTALYDTLIKPLRSKISHPRLVIVPHDMLHYVPFNALYSTDTQQYLIDEFTISVAPSASSLMYMNGAQTPNNGRLLALGNPDNTLPHAESEVRDIAAIYQSIALVQGQATETAVVSPSAGIDILHLAAHTVYNNSNPLFTAIELKGDQYNDGRLEVHEISGLDLSEINVVVLSACKSAVGVDQGGDDFVGLSRSFMYAGAPTLVTTLWEVNDESTAVLMTAFHRELADGSPPATALRTAQRELASDERWRSPYYWAPFTLVSDAKSGAESATLPESIGGWGGIALLGAVALAMVLGGALFWRKRTARI